MVPSVASWMAPNVIAHDPVPVGDESVQRPARLKGGAAPAALPAGPTPAGELPGAPLSTAERSVLQQPASSAVQTMIGMVAMRDVMRCGRAGREKRAPAMVSRMLRSCQDANRRLPSRVRVAVYIKPAADWLQQLPCSGLTFTRL